MKPAIHKLGLNPTSEELVSTVVLNKWRRKAMSRDSTRRSGDLGHIHLEVLCKYAIFN